MGIGPIPEQDPEDGEDGGGIFSEINITPVADLFLVLLIIVMVGAPAAAAEMIEQAQDDDDDAGLEIRLPTGQTAEIDPAAAALVVHIPREGEIVVNDTEVSDEELTEMFERAYARDENTQVVLRADEGVFHGRVVGVMERARQIGLSRLAIATAGAGEVQEP